ncbi:ImmA/IrrE family metallo-endopeptidase [Pelolinea submarina]|uniref:Zn-dependent peptidase ImmA (M78 family) n=1 Tax=Pelolinea submarina TaxID=913107 RepID=A0A347ZQ32_9CHLR|nr:ImmA/IrrE family metallo-endopeptidase [Pelolinea submarina]REG06258.1 Zn-dependent peptidase ImmA (M78 family) [Pelolinea submarina]BBB47413.1 hypothetical protein Pelsub_P0640 [Pelolinea submarina]
MEISTFREAKRRLIDQITSIKEEYKLPDFLLYGGENDLCAKNLGIKVEEKKMDYDFAGYLPANSQNRPQPIIWIDPADLDLEHKNFTFFHEISHHLIREDAELYSFLNQIADRNQDLRMLEDRFADIGAAEFLIPSRVVSEFIAEKGFSMSLLPELDIIFPASKPAITIQLAQCAAHKCFIIICANNRSDSINSSTLSNENNVPRLYIQYSSKSPSQEKYFVAKNTLIPLDHVINKVYISRTDIKSRDRIPFRTKTEWVTDCDAIYYEGRVFASFNIEQPSQSRELQPSLF